MTSVEEKEKGAAAWAANNFPLAVTHFTNAIEIGGDKDFLKVNRFSRNLHVPLQMLICEFETFHRLCIQIVQWQI